MVVLSIEENKTGLTEYLDRIFSSNQLRKFDYLR